MSHFQATVVQDQGVERLNVHCAEKTLNGVIAAKLKTIKDLKCMVNILYVCYEVTYEWRNDLVLLGHDVFDWATTC